MGLVFRIAERLGLARWLLRRGDSFLQTAPHPHSRRPDRAAGARRSRAQRAAAPIHHALPGVRFLSGAMASLEPAIAGHPGGALRRFVLWPLHLWLACRAGGNMALRGPCSLVAGILDSLADSGGARVPVVASRRAADAAPQAGRAARGGRLRAGAAAGIIDGAGAGLCSPA